MDDLTQLLNRAGDGGKIPAEQLLPLVYQKLREVAAEIDGAGGGRAHLAGHRLGA